MTTLVTPTPTPGLALVKPGRVRIARAVAFGAMLVPLMVLVAVNAGSPFDQIAVLSQVAVTVILFHAGGVRRTPRTAWFEYGALAMMLVNDAMLWSAGPEPEIGFGNGLLYRPLIATAAVLTLAATALLVVQQRKATGKPR